MDLWNSSAVVISLRIDPAPSVEADLVFAGYGLSNPEADYDDFQGMEVRGKVVVFLNGAPTSFSGPLAALVQSSVGMKPAKAEKLSIGSGHTFAQILEAANSNMPLSHFAIPQRLKAKVSVKRLDIDSQNIAAILPGVDPAWKNVHMVFSAHLDHIGIGKPINGGSIDNGAMDKASGLAAMLDVAAMLKESGTKLRRPVLFVAATGEEKVLLGSRYFANFPTVDRKSIVANINADIFTRCRS